MFVKANLDTSKIGVIVCLVFSLVGCAGMIRPVSEENLAVMKNVGVASALTDDFHLIHIGTTIFSNKYHTGSVPNWRIDEFVTTTLAAELSKTKRYKVGIMEGNFSRKTKYENDVDYKELARAAREQGFDTAVLVRPTSYDNAPFHKGGYGFFERTFFGSSDRCVYSLFIVEVFDIKTEKELALEWGKPCFDGDEDISWNQGLEHYSEAEMQDIETRLKERIENSIGIAVSKLRLLSSGG